MTPVRRALGIWAAVLVLIVVGGLLTQALVPQLDPMVRALIVTVVLFAATLVARARWYSWAEVGVNGPSSWRHRGLLLVPLVVALAPLALGVRAPEGVSLLVLAVGYALTGVYEELLWRGMVQRELAPTGVVRSVVIGAALFGTAHLGNVLFRESVPLVLAQAWGAFCFGIAYGALRDRVGTIVPLMVLHALTDMAAAVGALPKVPVLVAEDVVLLAFGITLLVRSRRREADPGRVAAVG